ncbi:MAG: hypothetical protein JWM86_82 [Thermoleophilia bacterium]|nr:hypothetical protein [Thermoleophilia bacterium]
MVANTPGILPKAGLVGSKIINYPFTIPKQLNESATNVGKMNHDLVEGITGALGSGLQSLEPRGPAKWFVGLLAKVNGSVQHSRDIATRNKTVFWDPFGDGMAQVGQALGGPGAYWYAKKAGIEQPTADTIKAALAGSLFKFPTAEELGGAPPAAAEVVEASTEAPAAPEAPAGPPAGQAPEAAVQAAEGAGQIAA